MSDRYTRAHPDHRPDSRRLTEQNPGRRATDLKSTFLRISQHCTERCCARIWGNRAGATVSKDVRFNQTSPSLLFALHAVCRHLPPKLRSERRLPEARGQHSVTAVQLKASDRFLVLDRNWNAAPMSDLVFVISGNIPEQLISDTYGVPKLNSQVQSVGWLASAHHQATEPCGGLLLYHAPSQSVLNPMAPLTREAEALFFEAPANPQRITRHRERLVASLRIPAEVLEQNMETAKRVVEVLLSRDGGGYVLPRPA